MRGRPTTLPEPWRSLAIAVGGVAPLSALLCSSQDAIHSWANGTRHPRGPTLKLIREMFWAFGINPPTF